jgi:hypothetical protein
VSLWSLVPNIQPEKVQGLAEEVQKDESRYESDVNESKSRCLNLSSLLVSFAGFWQVVQT